MSSGALPTSEAQRFIDALREALGLAPLYTPEPAQRSRKALA